MDIREELTWDDNFTHRVIGMCFSVLFHAIGFIHTLICGTFLTNCNRPAFKYTLGIDIEDDQDRAMRTQHSRDWDENWRREEKVRIISVREVECSEDYNVTDHYTLRTGILNAILLTRWNFKVFSLFAPLFSLLSRHLMIRTFWLKSTQAA